MIAIRVFHDGMAGSPEGIIGCLQPFVSRRRQTLKNGINVCSCLDSKPDDCPGTRWKPYRSRTDSGY